MYKLLGSFSSVWEILCLLLVGRLLFPTLVCLCVGMLKLERLTMVSRIIINHV